MTAKRESFPRPVVPECDVLRDISSGDLPRVILT